MKKYNLRDEYDYKNYWIGTFFKTITIIIIITQILGFISATIITGKMIGTYFKAKKQVEKQIELNLEKVKDYENKFNN